LYSHHSPRSKFLSSIHPSLLVQQKTISKCKKNTVGQDIETESTNHCPKQTKYSNTIKSDEGKKAKVNIFCYTAPNRLSTTEALRYMARTKQRRTYRYSFTDHLKTEGSVNPGPGCKEQSSVPRLLRDYPQPTGSNRGPSDPKSSTLTTMLSRHVYMQYIQQLLNQPIILSSYSRLDCISQK